MSMYDIYFYNSQEADFETLTCGKDHRAFCLRSEEYFHSQPCHKAHVMLVTGKYVTDIPMAINQSSTEIGIDDVTWYMRTSIRHRLWPLLKYMYKWNYVLSPKPLLRHA